MGGKSKAPKAPDYAAAAEAQGVANKETAIVNNAMNRVNQITPDGSKTWTMKPGADPNNPKVGDYIETTTDSPEQKVIRDYIIKKICHIFISQRIEDVLLFVLSYAYMTIAKRAHLIYLQFVYLKNKTLSVIIFTTGYVHLFGYQPMRALYLSADSSLPSSSGALGLSLNNHPLP